MEGISRADLVTTLNRNYVGSYRTLADHSSAGELTEIGPVFAFVTGVPLAFFNGCLVLESTTPAELDAGVEWLDERKVPFQVFVETEIASELREALLARGFAEDVWSMPGMVLYPLPEPPKDPPEITLSRVTNNGIEEWRDVLTQTWLPLEMADRLFPDSLAVDPEVGFITARLHGRPVGTSVVIRTGDVAGVYGVVTLPSARGRGVGTAATWEAVRWALAWGCHSVVLQSSEMAFPVYQKMGFRTITRYAVFERRAG
jgi:GNAT superfamily N-acetyltransferase